MYLDPSVEYSVSSVTASPAYLSQLGAVISSVKAQMAADRKSGALKQLQGNNTRTHCARPLSTVLCSRMVSRLCAADRCSPPCGCGVHCVLSRSGHIWAAGYAAGELQGTLFSDAWDAIKRWHAAGLRVCIYSSGSVEAQKLIFAHTDRGSMADCISGYFDTAVGAKQDSASYTNIATQLTVHPSRLLFLTDVEGEARACKQAGCDAMIVVREGNKPVDPACGIPIVHSFEEVQVGV